MPFEVRCTTKGLRTLPCGDCGVINRVYVNERSWRFTCRNSACQAVWVIGTAYFRVTRERSPRAPADLAIPARPDPEYLGSPITAERAEPMDLEPTIYGGVWRSGEPVTIEMADPTTDPRSMVWEERGTGERWRAVKVAMGTRYVAQPVGSDSAKRIYVGRKEWAERMREVGGDGDGIRVFRRPK